MHDHRELAEARCDRTCRQFSIPSLEM
jgi:hypothetical protein